MHQSLGEMLLKFFGSPSKKVLADLAHPQFGSKWNLHSSNSPKLRIGVLSQNCFLCTSFCCFPDLDMFLERLTGYYSLSRKWPSLFTFPATFPLACVLVNKSFVQSIRIPDFIRWQGGKSHISSFQFLQNKACGELQGRYSLITLHVLQPLPDLIFI